MQNAFSRYVVALDIICVRTGVHQASCPDDMFVHLLEQCTAGSTYNNMHDGTIETYQMFATEIQLLQTPPPILALDILKETELKPHVTAVCSRFTCTENHEKQVRTTQIEHSRLILC